MSATSLSSNEFCILQLLWTEGRALTRPEILEALPDKDWNPNSIHLILNNMIKKGVLQVNGVARCGRGYGRTYAPTMSQTEYAAAQAVNATPDMAVSERLLGGCGRFGGQTRHRQKDHCGVGTNAGGKAQRVRCLISP